MDLVALVAGALVLIFSPRLVRFLLASQRAEPGSLGERWNRTGVWVMVIAVGLVLVAVGVVGLAG